MNTDGFYGRQQAAIHHDRFGDLAHDAARVLAGLLVSRGLTAGHGHRPRVRLGHPRPAS